MTPEQRAVDVLRHYTHICGGAPYDPLFLGRLIVDAIAAAEQEARNAVLAEIQARHTKAMHEASEWRADHPILNVAV